MWVFWFHRMHSRKLRKKPCCSRRYSPRMSSRTLNSNIWKRSPAYKVLYLIIALHFEPYERWFECMSALSFYSRYPNLKSLFAMTPSRPPFSTRQFQDSLTLRDNPFKTLRDKLFNSLSLRDNPFKNPSPLPSTWQSHQDSLSPSGLSFSMRQSRQDSSLYISTRQPFKTLSFYATIPSRPPLPTWWSLQDHIY